MAKLPDGVDGVPIEQWDDAFEGVSMVCIDHGSEHLTIGKRYKLFRYKLHDYNAVVADDTGIATVVPVGYFCLPGSSERKPRKDKKMKLDYYLIPMEKKCVFQIVEMDERFRGRGTHLTHDGFEIRSEARPELAMRGACLRGKDGSKDGSTAERNFSSNKERDEYISKVRAAIEDWAENWPGWKEEESVVENENGRYQV